MLQVALRRRRQLIHHLGLVAPDRALLGLRLLTARPLTDVRIGLQDRVDRVLAEPEQQGVGLPEQLIVAVVGTAAGQIGGQRHAVAALVDRVHGPSHRHCVERVQADPLMHQHTSIIEGAEHARVTAVLRQ